MSEAVLTLNEQSLDTLVRTTSELVLIDFWAEWCAPCIALTGVLAELSEEQAGVLLVGRLNVIEHPRAAEHHNIKTIPTMIIFRDGRPEKRILGAKSKRQLTEMLRDLLV